MHTFFSIVRSGDAIYVRVGDHDLTRKYGSPGAQTLRVATTYIHHNHNSQTLDNDIALLKLHGQAELKDGVCLVCLPARGVSQAAGKRCTVTGYGYMGESECQQSAIMTLIRIILDSLTTLHVEERKTTINISVYRSHFIHEPPNCVFLY